MPKMSLCWFETKYDAEQYGYIYSSIDILILFMKNKIVFTSNIFWYSTKAILILLIDFNFLTHKGKEISI